MSPARRTRRARRVLFVFLLAHVLPGAAQSLTWPGAAPCNTTLQACIDATPAGGEVLVATNLVVDTGHSGTELLLPRGLALRAAPGFDPVLPTGVGVVGNPPAGQATTVEGLTVRDARIRFVAFAAGSHAFTVRRARLVGSGTSSGVDVDAFAGSTVTVTIADNRMERTNGATNFVSLAARDGVVTGTVAFNRATVRGSSASAYGLLAAAEGTGRFDVLFANNEVRGSFFYGALCGVLETSTGAPQSTLRAFGNVLLAETPGTGNGLCLFGGESALATQVSHNTILEYAIAIQHRVRPFSPPTTTQPISGYVIGNLLGWNTVAWSRDPIAAVSGSAVSNGQNLLFGNGADFAGGAPATAGSGTQTTDPLLASRRQPRLTAGSPAIGRGNPLAVPIGYPLLDADGGRRLKTVAGGGGNQIDIGAYEFGDSWFDGVAGAGNTVANQLELTHPSLDGRPDALALVTPDFQLGGVESNRPFGVYYNVGGRWAVFHQTPTVNMAPGAGYNLMVPAAGDGAFVHRVGATSPGPETVLDDAALNDLPDRIVLVTSNWNPPGSAGVYNDHNVSVTYAGGRWRIRNSDGAALPAGAAFNVYAQPPSPSAFVHVARPGNINGSTTRIDHPLLDGVPCARLMVTPRESVGDRRFDVDYSESAGRWTIFLAGGAVPVDAAFHVAFSPRQVAECSQPLFADGFED